MPADIWLPLYAADYLADAKVRGLTRAQRSVLIELWCFQWRDGPLPNDLATLCRMLGDVKTDDVQPVIAGFFTASENGQTLQSERLGVEKMHAERNIIMKSLAGKASAKVRRGKQLERPFNGRSTKRSTERQQKGNPTPSPTPTPTTQLQQLAAAERGGWPAHVAAAFVPVGAYPPGQIGKILAKDVRAYGEAAIIRAVAAYCRDCLKQPPDEIRYRGPADFAKRAGYWVDYTRPGGALELLGDPNAG